MKHTYHLIINTNAGSGNGKRIGEEIVTYLEEQAYSYKAYFTHYAGEEVEIAHRLAKEGTIVPYDAEEENEDYPLLIVLGGDGTLHQVLNALDDYSPLIPVAYIPGGSGNDFARGVGIVRKDAVAAFQQIERSEKPQSIHVLSYMDKLNNQKGVAVNNLGIGIDAAVVAATNDSTTKQALNKYKMGSLAYLFSIVKVLFTQKAFQVKVNVKGEEKIYPKAFLATATNHPYFGGGIKISPRADAGDKILDFVLVEKHNWFVLFWVIYLLMKGKHLESKYVNYFQAESFQLNTGSEQFAQVDGESISPQRFDLEFCATERLFWFRELEKEKEE